MSNEAPVQFLLDRFQEQPDKNAMILDNEVCQYGKLLNLIEKWDHALREAGVAAGNVVMVKADYQADTVACFLALLNMSAIVIPVATVSLEKADEFAEIGQVEFIVDLVSGQSITATGVSADHEHYLTLKGLSAPGIVLFSSGTTGASKGTVHNANRLLTKFKTRRHDLSTLAFLLFDHIGGIDTLLYCLSNASTLVFTTERTPEVVGKLIEAHKVEVLPTAPSFLNMMLMTGVHESCDLSSLRFITYGAEMMPQGTLERCADAFPNATLMQKYGTSEIGTMRSQSKDNRSRWVKIGGEGYQWRQRDGKLEVKTESAMLGYLNAPSPFTEDGYFITGDMIEVDGDYVRFLGRDSDIINVGGQKVFPAEIENMIKQLPEILEVAVYGQQNPMLGAVVCCNLRPKDSSAAAAELRALVRKHLTGKVEPYKIPQKFMVSNEPLSNARNKMKRKE